MLVKVLRKCMEKSMKGKIEKQTQLTEVLKYKCMKILEDIKVEIVPALDW